MQIDWNKIKEKYPKSYERLIKHYKKRNSNCVEVCYCDIESFFDDNGIIIETMGRSDNCQTWDWVIDFKFDRNIEENYEYCNTRNEAKQQAIYKAFEIMEAMNEKYTGN